MIILIGWLKEFNDPPGPRTDVRTPFVKLMTGYIAHILLKHKIRCQNMFFLICAFRLKNSAFLEKVLLAEEFFNGSCGKIFLKHLATYILMTTRKRWRTKKSMWNSEKRRPSTILLSEGLILIREP